MSDSKDAERLQRLEDEVVKLRALVSAMCSKIEKLEQQRPERCDNCDGSGLVSHKMTSLYCDDCVRHLY